VEAGAMPVRRIVRESVETILIAVVLALLIRGFVVESFQVQGYSLEPTLHDAERVLVNKFVYRFREPQRGDIIVFRCPNDPSRDFIKRVIALGGESVEIVDGAVFVNGRRLQEDYIVHRGNSDFSRAAVPYGHLFVLGDNRTNSEDSRYFGFVPVASVKGKAMVVYWPPFDMRIIR